MTSSLKSYRVLCCHVFILLYRAEKKHRDSCYITCIANVLVHVRVHVAWVCKMLVFVAVFTYMHNASSYFNSLMTIIVVVVLCSYCSAEGARGGKLCSPRLKLLPRGLRTRRQGQPSAAKCANQRCVRCVVRGCDAPAAERYRSSSFSEVRSAVILLRGLQIFIKYHTSFVSSLER